MFFSLGDVDMLVLEQDPGRDFVSALRNSGVENSASDVREVRIVDVYHSYDTVTLDITVPNTDEALQVRQSLVTSWKKNRYVSRLSYWKQKPVWQIFAFFRTRGAFSTIGGLRIKYWSFSGEIQPFFLSSFFIVQIFEMRNIAFVFSACQMIESYRRHRKGVMLYILRDFCDSWRLYRLQYALLCFCLTATTEIDANRN